MDRIVKYGLGVFLYLWSAYTVLGQTTSDSTITPKSIKWFASLQNQAILSGIDTAIQVTFKKGKYCLKYNAPYDAEGCGYTYLKIKSGNRVVLVDDVLPVNDLEIPNTSKSYGTYRLKGRTLHFTVTHTKRRFIAIGRPQWLRRCFKWETRYENHTNAIIQWYLVINDAEGTAIVSEFCRFDLK